MAVQFTPHPAYVTPIKNFKTKQKPSNCPIMFWFILG